MKTSLFGEYFAPDLVSEIEKLKKHNSELTDALKPFVKAYMDAKRAGEGWYGALDRIGEKELKDAKNTLYPELDTALKDLFQNNRDNDNKPQS